MCGEGCWKGVTVFCLAFGISVFIANDFESAELLPINTKITLTQPEQKCVPLDESLKYESLKEKSKTSPEKAPQENQKELKKLAEPQPQFYDSSKDSAEYKVLLHREKCFETQPRK